MSFDTDPDPQALPNSNRCANKREGGKMRNLKGFTVYQGPREHSVGYSLYHGEMGSRRLSTPEDQAYTFQKMGGRVTLANR